MLPQRCFPARWQYMYASHQSTHTIGLFGEPAGP
jgi:hypothetical protein